MRVLRPAVLVLLSVLVLAPYAPLLIGAVAGRYRYPAILPTTYSARGLRLVADPAHHVPGALATSLGVATATALLAVAVGLPAGRALGRHRFRGRRLVQALVLAPAVVPGLAVALGLQVWSIRYGLAGHWYGVALVHTMPALPYTVTVLAAAQRPPGGLEPRFEEQARSLGAGPLRTWVHVTLPMLAPALATAALFAFLVSWDDYVLTLLIGAGRVQTLPVLLVASVTATDATVAAAVALVLSLPPLLLVVLVGRVLARRDGAGASARPVLGVGR